jgi:hypothetical protein
MIDIVYPCERDRLFRTAHSNADKTFRLKTPPGPAIEFPATFGLRRGRFLVRQAPIECDPLERLARLDAARSTWKTGKGGCPGGAVLTALADDLEQITSEGRMPN